jgi:drug/metabolite transporter (DMT)-like permease
MPGGRAILAAVAGAACISSSAVVMQLAGSSASVTALGRCAFALPVLGILAWRERRRGAALTTRGRWLARIAGVFFSGELIVWSHSIADVGAGLGTVVTNLQVVLVALLGWWFLGERPHRRLLAALPVMIAGLALVGGVAGTGGSGTDPGLGALLGVGVAGLYAVYIFLLRQAAMSRPAGEAAPVTAPVTALFEATAGATFGAAVLGAALGDFRLGPAWPALGWLVLLALTSQVLGWLLITVAMPELPAWLVGVLLLVQPAGSLALSAAVLGERPSPVQLAGVALVLAGVLIAVSRQNGPAGGDVRSAQHRRPAGADRVRRL